MYNEGSGAEIFFKRVFSQNSAHMLASFRANPPKQKFMRPEPSLYMCVSVK